ncbi:MAG: HAMP domain-containing histidine kinase [Parasporobacterium sp.]|nr:HAMP domain-containing histidine kinase [Parasporobacterium sp.]
MSSNQNNRVTSITRKLHRMQAGGQLVNAVGVAIFTVLLTCLAFLVYTEIRATGSFSFSNQHTFTVDPVLRTLYYHVIDPAGVELASAEVYPAVLVVLIPAGGIMCLRILGILFGWPKENHRIRKILKPINELALKADQLSKMNFSEDKYQVLEDAITHIDPEQMQTLSLGDTDLAGVETAMNNLLIRMKESYQQQARFVNDASHELRTPIAIIEGYANMLSRWGTEDEKVLQESIMAIKTESAHMKHLVEQLLFLARGDSGRTSLQWEQVSLGDMMQEIYEESLMIDEMHPYRYVRPEQEILVKADSGLLKQAVRILVDNAAKYTNERDEILLRAGLDAGRPYIQVQDTGIGMAEADIAHMFERFYRSDEVRRFKGTGLGLSISKWIVDKHKGNFEVTSRVGLGTRIRILLPASSVVR